MAKKLLIRNIKSLFSGAKVSPYWEQLKKLPIVLRYILGIFCILFWILGIFTPIPAGVVFLIIGIALCVGIRRARAWTIGFVHFTLLHILYGKIYMWWQMHKKKSSLR